MGIFSFVRSIKRSKVEEQVTEAALKFALYGSYALEDIPFGHVLESFFNEIWERYEETKENDKLVIKVFEQLQPILTDNLDAWNKVMESSEAIKELKRVFNELKFRCIKWLDKEWWKKGLGAHKYKALFAELIADVHRMLNAVTNRGVAEILKKLDEAIPTPSVEELHTMMGEFLKAITEQLGQLADKNDGNRKILQEELQALKNQFNQQDSDIKLLFGEMERKTESLGRQLEQALKGKIDEKTDELSKLLQDILSEEQEGESKHEDLRKQLNELLQCNDDVMEGLHNLFEKYEGLESKVKISFAESVDEIKRIVDDTGNSTMNKLKLVMERMEIRLREHISNQSKDSKDETDQIKTILLNVAKSLMTDVKSQHSDLIQRAEDFKDKIDGMISTSKDNTENILAKIAEATNDSKLSLIDLEKNINLLVIAESKQTQNVVHAKHKQTQDSVHAEHEKTRGEIQKMQPVTTAQDLNQFLRPFEYNSELSQYNERFVRGTRKWILDTIEKWRCNMNGSRCLLLQADAGFGKTAIAAQVCANAGDVALAIHFCRHNHSEKRDPRRMVLSLAYQISEAFPAAHATLEKLREQQHALVESKNMITLFDELLNQPLDACGSPPGHPICRPRRNSMNRRTGWRLKKQVEAYFRGLGARRGRYLIIIDALDEAEFNLKNQLLDLIASQFKELPPWIAVLITSRKEDVIEMKLKGDSVKDFVNTIVLDEDTYKNECERDVETYAHHLSSLFSDQPDVYKVLRDDKSIKLIKEKAQGSFLYLHYFKTKLSSWLGRRKDSKKFSFEQLKDLLPPGGIGGFYKEQLKRYFGEKGLDVNKATRNVIEAIICSRMPPLVTDLVYLSQVEKAEIEKILEKISGLLPSRDDNRVYIFHKSFSDWLTGNGYDRSKDDSGFKIVLGSATQLHCRFAIACATSLINSKLKDSIYESDKLALRKLGDNNLINDKCQINFSLEQAFSSILYHLIGTNLQETDLQAIAFAVLCSMSFFDSRINDLKALSSELESLKPALKDLKVVDLLLEALKYVRESVGYQRLECKPAEFYEILWQIRLLNNRDELKESLNKLLNDARNRAKSELIFSRKDYTPGVGHTSQVNNIISFQVGDNVRLASCSSDTTIKIWDPINGKLLHTLEGHTDWVSNIISFQVDGYVRLASCSRDETIIIWDPSNDYKLLYTLQGHKSWVRSWVSNIIAFQVGDNVRLASCSSYGDNTIRIWDPSDDYKLLYTLKGHTYWVRNIISFQVDDNVQLASCSRDRTIRILDPSDDYKLLHTLRGHTGEVDNIIAFQVGDNVRLASCSGDTTIRIWDPSDDYKLLYTLKGHTGWVYNIIAFQVGDNVRLASCSYDKTIRIWDPINGKLLYTLQGQTGDVSNIISFQVGDNVRLASFSILDKTVRIWDPTKNDDAILIITLRENPRTFIIILAPENNKRNVLAVGFNNGEVLFWESPETTENCSRSQNNPFLYKVLKIMHFL